jgi:hypothetical protein
MKEATIFAVLVCGGAAQVSCGPAPPPFPEDICGFAERAGTPGNGESAVEVSCIVGTCDESRGERLEQRVIDDFCVQCEASYPGCTVCYVEEDVACADTGWQAKQIYCFNECI